MSAMTSAEYIGEVKQAGERYTGGVWGDRYSVADEYETEYVELRLLTEAECIRLAALLAQGAAELRRRREARNADTAGSSI